MRYRFLAFETIKPKNTNQIAITEILVFEIHFSERETDEKAVVSFFFDV